MNKVIKIILIISVIFVFLILIQLLSVTASFQLAGIITLFCFPFSLFFSGFLFIYVRQWLRYYLGVIVAEDVFENNLKDF